MVVNVQERTAPPAASPNRRLRWVAPLLVIGAFLLVGGGLGGLGGKLEEIQRNDSAAYLPASSEATRVLSDSKAFTGESTAAIVVYTKDSPITDTDKRDIVLASFQIVDQLNHSLAGPPIGPIPSDLDNKTAIVVVRFNGSDPELYRADVEALRNGLVDVPGFTIHVTGPAAAQADLIGVYGSINLVLLAVTGLAVLIILVVVYRSPILPFTVLAVAGIGLGMANGIAYLLGKWGVIIISGQVQGILDVLVLGAGTDYALLLASRFREELRRTEDRYVAMRKAWRATVAPVAASGSTVILALLCLVVSDLPATKGLGPVAALGIFFALVSMLFLLPAILLLLGRTAFWPFRPAFAGDRPEPGLSRTARLIDRRPRLVWAVTTLALAVCVLGLFRLEAKGVQRSESFLTTVDSVVGQDLLDDAFPASSGAPAVVIAKADHLEEVVRAVSAVPGVHDLLRYVDPVEAYERRLNGQPPPTTKVVDGYSRLELTLNPEVDSPEAGAVIDKLRDAVHAIPGADARVGGSTANTFDSLAAAQRDRRIVIPLVLVLVFIVLALLLRAVVAPLLLLGTVILSFLATLGICGVLFHDGFGFAGAEPSFPLLVFVFLVALGIDYTIFLMTRVREESAGRGHRAGLLRGLSVTGGVITSAGVVVAATFAALGVVPLVYLRELAIAVAIGVLLDTLVVRSLLVPALSADVGRRMWWPGPAARQDP
jgi:putative drug exporter of the RND superfamily